MDRREFLGSFLPKKTKEKNIEEKKEAEALQEKSKQGMTRRGFLEKAATVAGALALGIPEELYAKEAPKNEKKLDIYKQCWELPNSVYDFLKSEGMLNTVPTLQEKKEWRENFLQKFPKERLLEQFEFIYKNDFFIRNGLSVVAQQLCSYLAKIGCQGLLYDFLTKKIKQDKGQIEAMGLITNLSSQSSYYESLVEDFFPEAEGITPNQIDPRLNAYALLDDTAKKDLKERPGFIGKQRHAQFNQILSNKNIRERLVKENFTLAEAYSTAKAIIHYREQNGLSPESDSGILEMILLKQKEFKKRVILGKGFNLINFNYFEEKWPDRFSGRVIKSLAQNVGVDEDEMTVIEGKKDAEEIYSALRTAIINCEGPTTIYFNTHGLPFFLDLTEKHDGLSFEMFAEVLVKRLILKKELGDLGNINIILDSCYSHSFAKNLLGEVERIYNSEKMFQDENAEKKTAAEISGKEYSEINMPVIISAAQESSFSFTTEYDIEHSLDRNLEAIRKEGSLTGEYILHRIQPEVYVYEDMTIFSPQKGNEKMEIGLNSESKEQLNFIAA